MATDNHYFIEENANGMFTVRAKGSERASALFRVQMEAEDYVRELNPDDKPDVERVRNRETGVRDKWRSAS